MDDKIKAVQEALCDRYELKGVLGQGGASIVFEALDLRLNTKVAIKVLHDDPHGIGAARLQREAQTSARLQSPNIARVFNFGQAPDGTAYMVMELVEGKSLDRLIKERGRIEYKEAISIFRQIANGLSLAHKHDVVHRDLKPANVILYKENKEWRIKILDFGIAKVESDQKLTTKGSVIGSPLYMAPEQITEMDVDGRTDIYSLGCMMFEVLTGEPPFKGKTTLETFTMHKNQAPPLVSEKVEDVPPLLVNLIDQCLRKLQRDRPQTIDEVQNKLKEVVEGKDPEVLSQETSTKLQESASTAPSNLTALVSFKSVVIFSVVFLAFASAFFLYQIWLTDKMAQKAKNKKEIEYRESFPNVPKIAETTVSKFRKFVIEDGVIFESEPDTLDSDLKSLQATRVDYLRIVSSKMDGSGLKHLVKRPIRQLFMQASAIKPENIKYLTQFVGLVDVNLNASLLGDPELEQLCQVKTLQEIALIGGRFSKKGFEKLTGLPVLSVLTLNSQDFMDKDLEPLLRIPNLKVVRLVNCKNLSGNIGVLLAKVPRLDTLLINRPLSQASYKALARTNLSAINLRGKVMSQEEFAGVCSIKSLWRIHFTRAKVQDNNYAALSRLPLLRRFELTNEEVISPNLFSTLLKLNLKVLDFSYSGLTKNQLNQLLSVSSLEAINCFGCNNFSQKDLDEFCRRYFAKYKRHLNIIIPEKEKKQQVQFDYRVVGF